MKVKYVKLESPSNVPTYKRPSLIPGFNFANTDIFRTYEQFFEDLVGEDASKLCGNLMQQTYGLASFELSFTVLGKYRMYDFGALYSVGTMRYGDKYYRFNRSGEGMMAMIGNSYASYNMYKNGHKLLNTDGSTMYEWNSIWHGNGNGLLAGVLEENQFVKNDGTTTPFELGVEYSFGYFMYMSENIVSHGSATLEKSYAELFTATEGTPAECVYAPLAAGLGMTQHIYTHREDGAHGIKNVCMLGFKFYNIDGTTSLYEAEADKPYSSVYGEYPYVPQTFSHMNFTHDKPYTKVCITRRIRNDLRGSCAGLSEISYPFITVSRDTTIGSIDRKDILENELILGGNYPAGTSKDAYTSYELFTGQLPNDIEHGVSMANAIRIDGYEVDGYNIGSIIDSEHPVIVSTEKTSITNNGATTDAGVLAKTFGTKFKCFDISINASAVYAVKGFPPPIGSYCNAGPDGYPSVGAGSGSGSDTPS